MLSDHSFTFRILTCEMSTFLIVHTSFAKIRHAKSSNLGIDNCLSGATLVLEVNILEYFPVQVV